MPSTTAQVKNIILKHQGRASKQQLARELNLGLEYLGLICRELERKGELAFRKGSYLLTTATAPKKAPRSRRGKPRRQLVVARGKRKKGAQ